MMKMMMAMMTIKMPLIEGLLDSTYFLYIIDPGDNSVS